MKSIPKLTRENAASYNINILFEAEEEINDVKHNAKVTIPKQLATYFEVML